MPVSHLDKAEFMNLFGSVFEHSPWIAGAVWDSGLTGRQDTAEGLHQAFREVIEQSGREKKMALLRAHPELGVGIASSKQLTGASRQEQRGAGLDSCGPAEFAEFRKLNQSYQEKFTFPFIMAVKGFDRHDILKSFRERLNHTEDEEFRTAVEQVLRIGRFRIDSVFARYR